MLSLRIAFLNSSRDLEYARPREREAEPQPEEESA